MTSARLIPLRATTISRYRNRDGKAACIECGHEFKENDKAVSKSRGSARAGRKKVLLCPRCADEEGIVYSRAARAHSP